jgi:hypothetical protein
MVGVYRRVLKKTEEENKIDDNDPLSDTYPDLWLLVADSAYNSASKYVRASVVEKRTENK